MEAIELEMIQLLEAGHQITIEEMGGVDKLHANAAVIGHSKLMDEFLKILIEGKERGGYGERTELIEDIIKISVEVSTDPIAVRNAVELLGQAAGEYPFIFDILMTRITDSSLLSIVRGYFLHAAFEIAANNISSRYIMIGYLVQIAKNENPDYLKYVSKIVGLCYSAFLIEDLAKKLQEFVSAGIGEDDALYEMGLCYVTKGINSESQVSALKNFECALQYFDKASKYERYDANVYKSAILILKSYIDNNTTEELLLQLEALKVSISLYSGWNSYSSNLSWVHLRDTEIFYWCEMADLLSNLMEHLTSPAWFEPVLVIEKYLLKIYDCSRSILKRSKNGSLELLTRPIIYAKFIEQPDKVYLLEKWINQSNNPEIVLIANCLKLDIETYKLQWQKENVNGAVSDLLIDAVPSLASVSANSLKEFDIFVESYRTELTTNVSIIIQKVFNEVVEGLKIVSSFNLPIVQKEFKTVLFHTLRFLELRMDNTAANHPKAKYLFEKVNHPLESALQNDYYEFLKAITLNGKIDIEKMDVSGGRADVYFEYLSFNFCAEVKRELIDSSFTSLRDKYLGQAKEYQNTTVKVGLLLVLDLLPKPNGIGSLESNVKLETLSTSSDPEMRGIVVFRIPGSRVTPSSVKL